MGVVEPRNVSRRNRRAWWARFTFNGITRYERGTYVLVGGVAEGFCVAVELSDADTWPKASVAEPLRDQLLHLRSQRLNAFRERKKEWQPTSSNEERGGSPHRNRAHRRSGEGLTTREGACGIPPAG